ncbi:hypothetical protein AYI70_g9849 [Smittium culicis]|uniref:Retrotransposon gag domain-containing protein n=1 Tax=Smittium culicis TaxID=133412 RepID=A0A1R1X9E1_9FUNG|nr:hypothetical protein AYI70_g9849 [Smittium culicis]
MSRDVFDYIQTCKTCQLTKHSTQQKPGELQPIIVSEPFEMVSIDFAGPFPETKSGNRPMNCRDSHLLNDISCNAIGKVEHEIMTSIKLSLDTESRHRLEQAVAYEQLKAETAMKCEQLADKEASLYKQIIELQNNAGTNISAADQASLRNIPKIPSFDAQLISSNQWIFGADELFTNYPGLSDFQKRILVVDSLKGEARNWYDAEPDGNIDNWDNLRQSLSKQFGGAESLSMALDKIYTMRLTEKSDFNSFIHQIRQVIATPGIGTSQS